MIQLSITRTAKSIGQRLDPDSIDDGYRFFDHETKLFQDMAEAKAYLKETYGNCKTSPMYQDRKDGTTVRSGTIYHFKNADYSHAPVEHWYQQDWVSFDKLTPITL